MTDLVQELAHQLGMQHAKSLDDTIRQKLEVITGAPLVLEDLKGRLTRVIVQGDPNEHWCLDGKCFLIVGPIETEMDGTHFRATRKMWEPA